MRIAWSILLLALAAPQARAAGLCPPQPVRISFYEAGLFYFDGKGIDREVADELQRRTGCAIETSAPPRARAYVWLESGETDIVMAALNNPKREQYAVFVPYMQQRFVTVMHRDVPLDKVNLAAFSGDTGLRFGVVRGVTYGGGRDEWFAKMESERRLELGATLPTLFRMLKSKRFAAMFAAPAQYEKELADLGMRDQVRLVDWFPNDPPPTRCLAMSRKNFTPAQVRGWAEVVQGMKADGSLKRILAKYLSADEAAKAVIK
ncbi:substrate-binding periplasmic protein [Duganella aceris]|uniref:Amino acid ABC transporter substrate-binding protein n=1 Tax=Duganella aceris TaxID=2703883 RepID=A0ABX0FSA4_9BURK|nr:transporter substrate-binding domain-containing protein [Duganella aceris]NGZ87317.1 amino acid ABC transporter substrate-binding protein [Duganella aceris]